jgi:hypothetical protein
MEGIVTRKEAAEKIAALANCALVVQVEHGRRLDSPSDILLDCAEALSVGTLFLLQDTVIVRGTIDARKNISSAYHEAIVPVLQEALDVLESLTGEKP